RDASSAAVACCLGESVMNKPAEPVPHGGFARDASSAAVACCCGGSAVNKPAVPVLDPVGCIAWSPTRRLAEPEWLRKARSASDRLRAREGRSFRCIGHAECDASENFVGIE